MGNSRPGSILIYTAIDRTLYLLLSVNSNNQMKGNAVKTTTMQIGDIEIDTTFSTMQRPVELVRLIVECGRLMIPRSAVQDALLLKHFTGNPCVMGFYGAGDCYTIQWPNPNRANLAYALYDAREMELIPNVRVVLLPDGSPFEIDTELATAERAARQKEKAAVMQELAEEAEQAAGWDPSP